MRRATLYALAGGAIGIACLAAFGAIYGYLEGAGAHRQYSPGFEGMAFGALIWTGFLWPIAGGFGVVAGFAAGLVGSAIQALVGKSRGAGRGESSGGVAR